VLRSGSAEDGAAGGELIRPYSVELLPAADQVVSTNTAMHELNGKSRTVQVCNSPACSRCGRSRSRRVRVATNSTTPVSRAYSMTARACWCIRLIVGFTLMRGVDSDNPSLRFVYGFPGSDCGVPLRIGHWWLATVPETHSLTVLDISDPEKPREVSRVTFDAGQKPHWVAADLTGTRIVLNSDENGPDHRLFIVNFDPQTGSAKHSATGAVTARA
jgi:hypothetical protein